MFSLRILQRKIENLETTHTFQVRLQYIRKYPYGCIYTERLLKQETMSLFSF